METKWAEKKKKTSCHRRASEPGVWRRVIRRAFATLHAATLGPAPTICDTHTGLSLNP